MTDWTKPQKKSKIKYAVIPIAIVTIAIFFLAFDVTPNEAMGKKLTDIQNLEEIENLQSVIYDQYDTVSLMIQNGTEQTVIDNFTKDITKNLKDLGKLVDTKKNDFKKYKIDKEVWKKERHSNPDVVQAEIDCPNHPFKPGHLVFDPSEIENAIYERCFEKP